MTIDNPPQNGGHDDATDLAGQVVLVSGATGGIGSAVVEELARSDATVVLLGRNAERLEQTRWSVQARTGDRGRLIARTADINDSDSVDGAVAAVLGEAGRIDAVVHAAGDGPVASLAEATDAMWQRTLNGKLMGAVRLTRAVAGHMAARNHGRIVMVNGAFRITPDPLFPVNSAVNAALAAFAKAASRDLGRSGIRVNVVDPGAVDTELWSWTAKEIADRCGGTAEDVNAQVVAQTPLGSLTRPADVARLVRFLLSPAAGQITGTAITLDGGACAAL
jgi:NAD(P)-dependent dehydrogenase (short-subunit alcohol dehydrogenase family)